MFSFFGWPNWPLIGIIIAACVLGFVLGIACARRFHRQSLVQGERSCEIVRSAGGTGTRVGDLDSPVAGQPTYQELLEYKQNTQAFISHVAHEMRAPLTLCLAPVESLLEGKHGALRRGQKQTIEIIYNNAIRLLQTTVGLLDDAACGAGALELHREPTAINALTAGIITDFMPYMEQRQVECKFNEAPGDPVLEVDRYLYERVLFNLLSNAAKFTRPHGRVVVSLDALDGHLQLSVKDTGIGIAEEDMPLLFKRFHQAKSCASRRFEGTGLGLALVKEFAELMGGDVSVESQRGVGSQFIVNIVAPESVDGIVAPPNVQSFKKMIATTGITSDTRILHEMLDFRARVLVADDNNDVAQFISQLLSPLADVRTCESGREALIYTREWHPHVIVADVLMKDMDGLELCRCIKEQEETSGISVILLSSMTNREMVIKGWESGADDYLYKPFHPSELLTRVKALLKTIRERVKMDEKIQSLNRTLEQRVSELDTANEELRWLTRELQTARDSAIGAARTKAQFLSNMSHELRTPLNGLIATTELLLQTQLSDEQREFACITRESAFALLETVSDLLDFSRMESGKLSLELIDFDIVALVEGCAELMSMRARQKNLSLMTYVANDVPKTLVGDPARLRQVLINLISNAIKFTDHGEVVCRVTLDGLSPSRASVRCSVYDTGIGMSKSAQRALFEPFVQVDGSNTRRHGGAGLGLSIARRLVELMGGNMGVDSAEGQGSTFWFVVPLEHRDTGDSEETKKALNLRNLRVLMVDGMQETQKVIQEYAHSWQMTCATTNSAGEAIALAGRWNARRKPFDLMVVDFSVSDMHAFTLARYVQNSSELSQIKLILLTSDEEEGRGERALRCGYSAYLRKPIKQSQLLDCMLSVLASDPPQKRGAASLTVDIESSLSENAMPDTTLRLPGWRRRTPVILLVEDNPLNQRVTRIQLEELGYRVHLVTSGKEALDATVRFPYDLILMDCAMPGVDGYETTERIRKQEALMGRHTPIIALTAHSLPGDREKCLESGMDDYLGKPVSKEELQAAIKRWLKVKRTVSIGDETLVLPDEEASIGSDE
jgi:signal transduction histidine kinase